MHQSFKTFFPKCGNTLCWQSALNNFSCVLLVDRQRVSAALLSSTEKTGSLFSFRFTGESFLLGSTCEAALFFLSLFFFFTSVAFWWLSQLIKKHPLCHIRSTSGRRCALFFMYIIIINSGTPKSELHGRITALIKKAVVQLAGYGAYDTRGTPWRQLLKKKQWVKYEWLWARAVTICRAAVNWRSRCRRRLICPTQFDSCRLFCCFR